MTTNEDNINIQNLNINNNSIENTEKLNEIKKPHNEGPTKTIMFCLYGKEFSSQFLISWSEIILQCILNNYRPLISMDYDKNVFLSKNKILGGNILTNNANQKVFQGSVEYDYVLMLDKSVVFTFNDLTKLIDSPYECTSGVYLLNNEYTNVVSKFNMDIYKEQNAINFVKYEDLIKMDKIDNRYIKCEFVDNGWLMFKKGALEKLDYPWFDYKLENSINVFSDSYSFCKKLEEYNIDIMVDTNFKMAYLGV